VIKSQIKNLSTKTGIYIFKDEKGNILYIGKAKNIKKRVLQYFKKDLVPDKKLMLQKVKNIEYTL